MRARLQALISASSVASTECRRHVLVPRFLWDTSPCWPSSILCNLDTCTRSYMLIHANIGRARSTSLLQLSAQSGGSTRSRLVEYCERCQTSSYKNFYHEMLTSTPLLSRHGLPSHVSPSPSLPHLSPRNLFPSLCLIFSLCCHLGNLPATWSLFSPFGPTSSSRES